MLIALTGGACGSDDAATSEGPGGILALEGDVTPVHDPAVAADGQSFFLFSTGPGIPIRRSTDLRAWEYAGQVFADAVPAWAPQAIPGADGVWAPDVSHFGGHWHLYYAVSTFASLHSAIGHATNTTLDPRRGEYAWVDHGPVVTSEDPSTGWNAIDPNVAIDDDGRPWLAWGAFWGGIKLARLDPADGTLDPSSSVFDLAIRNPWYLGIEAAFLIKRGAFWYLFVSFNFCCRGVDSDYEIRVGRSATLTGPYVDDRDTPLTDNGGRLVLAGYGTVRGPGHNAVLHARGRWWLVHHWYDAANAGVPTLGIRELTWTADAWPLAAGTAASIAPPR